MERRSVCLARTALERRLYSRRFWDCCPRLRVIYFYLVRICLHGQQRSGRDALPTSRRCIRPPFPFTVHDVVLMGRAAHIGSLGIPWKRDQRIADDAIEMLGIAHLSQKIYTKISGGERQLVLLARAIAQQPRLLCMDEPTASLDFGNQVLVMNRIRALSATGITVIMTTHAPSHAFYCADQPAVMGRDGVFFVGRTNDVITEQRLEKLYGVTAKIVGYNNVPESRTCVPLPPQ